VITGVTAVVTTGVGNGVARGVGTGVVPSGDPDREFMKVKDPAIIMTTIIARAAIAIREVLFGAGGTGAPGADPVGGTGGGASVSAGNEGTGESVDDRTGHCISGTASGEGD
jgi:hypothetical protein